MAPPQKLLDHVRAVLRGKHYSRNTEDSYVDWIKRYILFHQKRHPRELGQAEEVAIDLLALGLIFSEQQRYGWWA